jgi:hypothetical protein
MRTRSLSSMAASATVINGEANEIAVTSASGSRASAAKLKNMPAAPMVPRPNCPMIREVRNAASSSRRSA